VVNVIVAISGLPGSGKSTLAKNLAKALGLKHYSAGGLLRQIAKERGLGLIQLHEAMEHDKAIDEELDRRTAKLAEKEDDFVIDGRVAWHFIPQSVKIFVKVDLKVAAERVFADTQAGKEERGSESENISVEHTVENMKQRIEMNKVRYKKLYGIDYLDEKNYDLVLDTSKCPADETLEKALAFVKQKIKKGKRSNID